MTVIVPVPVVDYLLRGRVIRRRRDVTNAVLSVSGGSCDEQGREASCFIFCYLSTRSRPGDIPPPSC